MPFKLPPVDRVALRAALDARLNKVLAGTPDDLFDPAYWTDVFYDGIDPLIKVPRDVVRFTNTLSVTYPAVRGEVNPVDFIALEAIRVFLPNLYEIVRTNPDKFSGNNRDDEFEIEQKEAKAFRQQWVGTIPKQLRASTQKLLGRIFPKVGEMGYNSEWLAEWRRNLRACHPDVFPIFVRFSVPGGAISRSEVMELVNLAEAPDKFCNLLVRAKEKKHTDGASKARALLERLMDHIESDIPDAHVPQVIQAFLSIGDELIDAADEHGIFDIGTGSLTSRLVYHLLKRIEADRRTNVLKSAIRSGNALAIQSRLLKGLEEEATRAKGAGEDALLCSAQVKQLQSVWLDRVRMLSKEVSFLERPELSRLLFAWSKWSSKDEVRTWCDQSLSSNKNLFSFLIGFLQYTQSQTMGDWAVRRQPRLDPVWLENYLDSTVCADRLRALQRNEKVPPHAKEAVTQFLKEFDMAQEGRNLDDGGKLDYQVDN